MVRWIIFDTENILIWWLQKYIFYYIVYYIKLDKTFWAYSTGRLVYSFCDMNMKLLYLFLLVDYMYLYVYMAISSIKMDKRPWAYSTGRLL